MKDSKNNTLIIITRHYPYGAVSESFLDPEIPHLCSIFHKIIIVPTKKPTFIEKTERNFPSNVTIENSFIQNTSFYNIKNKPLRNISRLLIVIRSRHFYREVINNFSVIVHKSAMTCLVKHLSNALYFEKWLKKYIQKEDFDLSKTIFYTYWLMGVTSGIAFTKIHYPEIKLISRAHAWDLYEERHMPHYIPYRKEIFQYLNKLFLISEYGKQYIVKRYPKAELICTVAKLGVMNPNFTTKTSSDEILRIVSCSYVSPIKRIDVIIRGLAKLSELRPENRIKWVHIGYGSLLPKIKNLSKEYLPTNIEFSFTGYLQNVIQYYKDNCVDIFINTSASEGIPVTIMEVQSCGIPVIATSVGGTPEIVSDTVGVLLSENPTPLEVASAICRILDNPEKFREQRLNSKKNWEANYNAERNFSSFAKQLKEL